MKADDAFLGLPPDADQYLEAAYASLQEDQLEDALRACEAALELAPRWAQAHNLRGLVLDELGRIRDAAEAYHTALKIDADYEDAQDNLLGALTELMTGELSALVDLEEDPEELARDHLLWAYDLVDEDIEEEELDLELALWESDLAISLSPGLAEAHNLRGTILDELGRPEEAKEAFRAALELDPGFRAARENLELMEADETGQSATDGPTGPLDRVRCPICGTENPPTASSCRQCGFGFTGTGGEGARHLEGVAGGGESPRVDIRAPAPEGLVDENDQQAAAEEYLELAYDHNERGVFGDALIHCDAALATAPGLAEAHNLRGIVLEALGRPDEALEAYRTAVQLEPGFEDARENLRELEAELAEDDPVVTVTRFINPLEAQAARLVLAEQGIWSLVLDESLPINGVRLVARESDLDQVVQVLDLEADDDEGWQCPMCGSWDVDVVLLGRKCRCESCGHEWKLEA